MKRCLAVLAIWVGAVFAAPAQINSNSVLILHDSSGPYGWLGGMHAKLLANLLAHFDLSYQIAPVENYQAGDLDAARTTFYFGSTYDNPLPAAFKQEVMATAKPVCWFRYNLWQISGTNFNARFGFQFNWLDWSGYSNVVYKGESFLKNQLDPELGFITVLDTNLATVVATASMDNGASIPYATRSGNFWYVSDTPFDYLSEEDRYLVFADLLHDILGIDHPASHSAIMRIEDVAPTMYTPQELRQTADLLKAENVPFAVALVPVYKDPLGSYNGVPEEFHMADTSDAQSVAFVDAIRHMVANGAQLILHGYTHQYSDAANPYNGVTGDDFEFWRETFSGSDPDNPFALDLYEPVPEDSVAWVSNRVQAGLAEVASAGLSVVAWETPHYSASALDYSVFASTFPLTIQRCLYFDDDGHIAGQFFPYLTRDIYGQVIVPENIGNVSPEPWYNYPVRLPADLIRAARKNLVVRDGWASGYFHPFLSLDYLRETVRGIKALGYTYVPLSSSVPPAITSQPQNRTNAVGTSATFSVTATGTAPLLYQWRSNGADISGATNTSYAIASVQTSKAGNYTVVVGNAFGSVTSAIAVLTVGVPPAITTQPTNRSVTVGSSTTFSVVATGTAPLRYQWRRNGSNISGATNTSYTIASVQTNHAGNYTVVVSNPFGAVTSAVATLTVVTLGTPPAITAQPQSCTNVAGTSASFSVTATGTAPLRYQWRFNGANLSAATNATLTLRSVKSANAGDYSVLVTNSYGSVASAVATLTVVTAPTITAQPQNLAVRAGQPASFSVTATGTAPLRYQWQHDGVDLPGATNTSLVIPSATATDGGKYRVRVANDYGSVLSANATLRVK